MADPKRPPAMAPAGPPRRARAASVPSSPSSSSVPDPGAQLEAMNDQLARFFEHADQLVDEWARFGADVRRTVDLEAGRLDQAVSEAIERAGGELDRRAAARLERVIEESVARLRRELGRPAGIVGGAAGGRATAWLIGGVLLADALLIALLVLVVSQAPAVSAPSVAPVSPAGPAASSLPASGVPRPIGEDDIAAEVRAACTSLASGTWSTDAALVVMRAGTAACGDDEAQVRAHLGEHLAAPGPASPPTASPVDAGVDAPPPDAKGRRPRR